MDSQSFSTIEACLSGHRIGVGAAELHGSVVGYLSAGGAADADRWCTALTLEGLAQAMQDDTATERTMQAFFRRARAELADTELGFEPLLPDVERPLAERANGLFDWCRGYLGGFGLAAVAAKVQASVEAGEILGDIARIAASPPLATGDEPEEDEADLMELLEYVRIGVLLLHAEYGAPQSPAGAR